MPSVQLSNGVVCALQLPLQVADSLLKFVNTAVYEVFTVTHFSSPTCWVTYSLPLNSNQLFIHALKNWHKNAFSIPLIEVVRSSCELSLNSPRTMTQSRDSAISPTSASTSLISAALLGACMTRMSAIFARAPVLERHR